MERILVIDDEALPAELISELLQAEGYKVTIANSGEQAWELVMRQDFKVILLDYMMPGMGGIGFLRKIKKDPQLRSIPIIMQTGVTDSRAIIESLSEGVKGYLFKPFPAELLYSVVRNAIDETKLKHSFQEQVRLYHLAQNLTKSASFEFRTANEAQCLSHWIGELLEEPDRMSTGVLEVLINAIEHGNLGLTYKQKQIFMEQGQWEVEIEKRGKIAPYCNRVATLETKKDGDSLLVRVTDQGQGFDWTPYLRIRGDHLTDPNGRGIAMARFALPDLSYHGKGNEVSFSCKLKNSLLVAQLH